MRLAREGWGIAAAVAGVAAAATALVGALAAMPLWVLLAFVLQFFRDPHRAIDATPNAVLSAADGRVVYAGTGHSPLDGSEKLKISVFMNVFNVHANRAPVAGEVVHSQRFPGSFFNAALDKSSQQNERHLVAVKTAAGDEVLSVQIAGLLARRVLCYAKLGDALAAGQRYGFIRFGSRVDLYLPTNYRLQTRLGDKVQAGHSVLALAEEGEGGEA